MKVLIPWYEVKKAYELALCHGINLSALFYKSFTTESFEEDEARLIKSFLSN